jgi:hypothetical protein
VPERLFLRSVRDYLETASEQQPQLTISSNFCKEISTTLGLAGLEEAFILN